MTVIHRVLLCATVLGATIANGSSITVQGAAVGGTAPSAAGWVFMSGRGGSDQLLTGVGSGESAGFSGQMEVCLAGFCGGGPGPATMPSTLKLTNTSITCGSAICASTPLRIDFQIYGLDLPTNSTLSMSLTASANTTSTINGTMIAAVTDSTFLSSLFNTTQNVAFVNGSLSQSFGPFNFSGTVGYIYGSLRFDSGIGNGTTITFANSADLILNGSTSSTPEPGSITLVLTGLAWLGIRRGKPWTRVSSVIC